MTIAIQLSASEKTHAKTGIWRGDPLHEGQARSSRIRKIQPFILPGFLSYTRS